jgi:hypothetical protein
MRTSRLSHVSILGVLVVALSILAFAVILRSQELASSGLAPEEALRLGISIKSYDGPALDRARILELARAQYDPPYANVQVQPFLHRVTDPGRSRSDRPMTDQPIWIVRYSGLEVHSPSDRLLHTRYLFFDATSGEYVGSTWQE